MEHTAFKTSFENNDFSEWQKRLLKEIKLDDYSQAVRTDRNGIDIEPIYHQAARGPVSISRRYQDWWIVSRYIVNGNEKSCNQQILKDLNEGVSGIKLIIQNKETDIDALLHQIDPRAIQIIWKTGAGTESTQEEIVQTLKNSSYDFSLGMFHIESDALYDFHETGLYISAQAYNNSGANSITELGCILSQLNEGLHELEKNKQLDSCHFLSVSLSIDTQYFEQIAKLRALRILCESVLQVYGLTIPVYIHCDTSCLFLTQKDHHSNLIRNTIAAMSAVTGGADSLTITPHDYYVADQEQNSDTRLAKNQQLLLKEESYFTTFLNAPDGSYFIEKYTMDMSDKAYALFQQIESQGGWRAAKDFILSLISRDKDSLVADYKDSVRTLIGVNKFPNNMEDITVKAIKPVTWQDIPYINLEQELSR